MSFEGFSADALRFLMENKINNSKQWYEDHKDEYRKWVANPFTELVNELGPAMLRIDSQIIIKPTKVISRVRRDTRFTHDKSLYRDNIWIVFLRDKSRMSTSACYWFELGQKGTSYGVGFYGATPQSMTRMRAMIMDNHPAFQFARKCYESQNRFTLGGETYKKSKFPDQPEKLKTWLDRKNIYFDCSETGFNLAFSKELPRVLQEGYMLLKPIYDFLCLIDE